MASNRTASARRLLDLADATPRNPTALALSRAALRFSEASCRRLEVRARAAFKEPPDEFRPATEALFDLVAASDLLSRVAPSGKLPRNFAARCLSAARQRSRALMAERAALALGVRLARVMGGAKGLTSGSYAPLTETGSLVPSPPGPTIRGPAGRLDRDSSDPRATWTQLRALARDLRAVARRAQAYPGEPEEGLRAGLLPIPGTALAVDGKGHLHIRSTVPGSGIVVGAATDPLGRPGPAASDRKARRGRAVRARRNPRDQMDVPVPVVGSRGFDPSTAANRLGKALAVIDAAWPAAGRQVRERTRLVIPCEEPGLVSYSLASRPGVSFLNLRGKRLVDLADDLLHESAHHVLHDLESRGPLVARPRQDASLDEPRFWSPWRRAPRPARGILHACFTFAYRAALLESVHRIARSSGGRAGPLRVSRALEKELRREARKERAWIRQSLKNLRNPSGRGLLTHAGQKLLRGLASAKRAGTLPLAPSKRGLRARTARPRS